MLLSEDCKTKKLVFENLIKEFVFSRLDKLQRSVACFGIMRNQLDVPLEPVEHDSTMVSRGLRRATLNCDPIMPRNLKKKLSSVKITDVIFFQTDFGDTK